MKNVLLVNDQFPGPMIEANWGDWIEGKRPNILVHLPYLHNNLGVVELTNNISRPEEGTALHWHGLLQSATPWYDGTPSIQQCPVAPSTSFT